MKESPQWRVLSSMRTQLALVSLIVLSACTLFDPGIPLKNVYRHPALLTFGLYVTPDPAQNPIDPPERFTGYHTAVDYEILPGEEDAAIAVFAACEGTVAYASTAEGYGGVLVQHCKVKDQDVTVLYGHVDPHSFTHKVGDTLHRGEQIAVLAAAKSPESDGNRKHLHFGVHSGTVLDYRGYVQQPEELEDFIDPMTINW